MPEKYKRKYSKKSRFGKNNLPIIAGGLVVLSLIGTAVLTKLSSSNSNQGAEITVDTDHESLLLSDVMQKYVDMFGCNNEVTLSFGTIDHSNSTRTDQAGTVILTPESAGPGWITIDRTAIAMASSEAGGSSNNFYDLEQFIVAHAMTHACLPFQTTYLDTPYVVDQIGNEAIGYQGLTMIVRTTDGVETKITSIEESIADVLAEEVTGLSLTESGYASMGIITRHFINKMGITPDMLAAFVQSSDIPGFTAAILGKSSLTVTETDIRSLLMIYNSVDQGIMTPEEAIAFVEANSQ